MEMPAGISWSQNVREIFERVYLCHAPSHRKAHTDPKTLGIGDQGLGLRQNVKSKDHPQSPVPTMVQFVRREPTVESGHSTTKLTYADYVRLPDDGLRHEIIDGEHYVTPSPTVRHQQVSGRLFHLVQLHLDTHPIGTIFYAPLDALLSQFDIVVPDLVYISNDRSRFLTSKNLQGPPDLVIEILSPGTARRDQRLKRNLYERAGVQEYWLVDPLRDVIDVYRAESAGVFAAREEYARTATLTTPLFPGLEIPLDRVFARTNA
jgi:Uma2 family endonuclease